MPSSILLRASLFALLLSTAFAQPSGQYALFLKEPPVSARFAGHEAMRSTAAESYRQQVVRAQESLRQAATARGITVTGSAEVVLNAVFVAATADRLAELQSLPGVLGVVAMRLVRPALNSATTLQNAPAAWTALGGQGSAGAGVKIGILDFGIDQTHPALQDSSLSYPPGFPKCNDGHPEDCTNFTNTKVIVARSYVRLIAPGSSAANPAADSRPDDFSPRDREGHGTAIASVIAGNPASGTVKIRGMAPKAWLGNYKVYGSPYVNDAVPESVIIQALNDAIKDGMDVVNFSGGVTARTGALDTGAACGQAAGVFCDVLAAAFENAAKSIVVVVSAGNSGADGNFPTLGSISSPASAPSVIAVGAVSNSHYFDAGVSVAGAPAGLQNIPAAAGDDPYSPIGAYSARVIDVTTLGDDGLACSALPATSLNGAFALIQRGTCSFASKVNAAFDAGALGVILYMADATALIGPLNLDQNGIPAVMISQSAGQALLAYVKSNPAALVTIDPSNAEVPDIGNANLLSYYSSIGPNLGDNALKPDLVAVGTTIYMAAQNYDPLGGQFSSTRYATASGTSFSSPMVAGAAALVKQKHPTWTPSQIRSALINTASQDVTLDDSKNTIDPVWIGAGKLDAGAAVNATVVANPTAASFGLLAAAPSNLTKRFTISNLGAAAVTLTVAVVPGTVSYAGNLDPAAIAPTVDKASLPVPAGGTASLSVTLSGALPKPGYYTGAITLKKSPDVLLTIPYLYLVGGGTSGYNIRAVNACSDGNGCFEGIVGQQPFDPLNSLHPHSVAIKLTDGAGLPVSGASATWSVTPPDAVTFLSASTTTDAYGIGTTDITIQRTGNITVTASVGGQSKNFSGYGWAQATISAGGIVDAGARTSPIAPGSYVEIYGANLSEYTDSVIFAPNALPLSLNGVTVSFDVPAAKLSYPGRILFVSPGQINVQVPWELQGQTSAQVKVTLDSFVFGNVVTVPLADTAPAFFENSGVAAALDQNYAAVTAANPVKRGQIVQLFMNGLGPVTGGPASGEFASSTVLTPTKATPVVTIGGKPAEVKFSGLAPGFPGLYQVNAVVPVDISAGAATISLTISGATTKAATLPVK